MTPRVCSTLRIRLLIFAIVSCHSLAARRWSLCPYVEKKNLHFMLPQQMRYDLMGERTAIAPQHRATGLSLQIGQLLRSPLIARTSESSVFISISRIQVLA